MSGGGTEDQRVRGSRGQGEVLKSGGWGWEVLKSGQVGERYQGVEVLRRRGLGVRGRYTEGQGGQGGTERRGLRGGTEEWGSGGGAFVSLAWFLSHR